MPVGAIAEQARLWSPRGYREVVLTGVDITAFGGDLPGPPSLGQLVPPAARAVPELERLRLSSLDPVEIDAELWRLIAEEPRLMPHLHLSLQAGDDLVLKRMKRRHTRAEALAVAAPRARAAARNRARRRPHRRLPDRERGDVRRTLDLIDEGGLDYLHVFPYSPRPGTPAARMPQCRAPWSASARRGCARRAQPRCRAR